MIDYLGLYKFDFSKDITNAEYKKKEMGGNETSENCETDASVLDSTSSDESRSEAEVVADDEMAKKEAVYEKRLLQAMRLIRNIAEE